MNKDVIYVDTDDDITSIIGKVKDAKEHVVALVPPKRTGVLHSAVNLKLLQRAAGTADKRVVLITADSALTALASGAKVPVAKNLQSKPELIESDKPLDADDDIINGEEIAVGELATLAVANRKVTNEPEDEEVSAAVAAISGQDATKKSDGKSKKADKAKKIPNYSKFRKRLLIFGSLGLVLIAFLVWAIWFAPKATITVTAKTTATPVSATITLDPSAATNIDANTLQPVTKQIKKTNTVEFSATGSKEVGEAAHGSVTISNCSESDPVSLAAGTTIASGSYQYTLNQGVTVPGMKTSGGACKPGVSGAVGVTAANIGSDYNLSAGTKFAVSGYSASLFSATAQSAFTGGSKETVTVVQQSDVDKAADALKKQDDTNEIKSQLISQLGSDVTVLQDSFTVAYGNVSSNPDVGKEAKTATASMEVTYSIMGIGNKDLNEELNALATKTMDDPAGQKIYDNGAKNVKFTDYAAGTGGAASVKIATTAQVGPKIDANQVAEQSAHKRAGEIQESLTKIPGVENVEVDFSPFWVSKTPDADKISVKFSIDANN